MPTPAPHDARGRVRRLIDAGERLSEEIHGDLLRLGDAGVPALLEILEDDLLAQTESRGDGWAPVHAARVLGEMRAAEAIEPMLRVLARTDGLDILHDQVLQALPGIGAPVLEPALSAATSSSTDLKDSVAGVLASLGVRDDRILDILLDQLGRDPSFAGNLAIYGDPDALPYLLEALDAFQVVESSNPLDNHGLIELRGANEDLGGTLSAEQQQKCRRGLRATEAFRRELRQFWDARRRDAPPVEMARRHDRPGRNAPCWCGSGKKYKKCHLAADEGGTSPAPS